MIRKVVYVRFPLKYTLKRKNISTMEYQVYSQLNFVLFQSACLIILVCLCETSLPLGLSYTQQGSAHLQRALSFPSLYGAFSDETGNLIAYLHQNYIVNVTETDLHYLQDTRVMDHVSSLSSCPWKYVLTRDDNRIPSTLVESRCIGSRCQSENSADVQGRCRSYCQCQEVYRYVQVKRKRISNSLQNAIFGTVWERMAVGCTCTCDF